MNPQIQTCCDNTKALMEKAILHLESELSKVRAGKANPAILDNIYVDYYGTRTPLNQVANVNTQDARTLVIQPWEKTMIDPIAKAITEANLGLNPQNDSNLIRINVPALTEERRKELVKKTKSEGENCKISLRTIRKEANDSIKGLLKKGVTEDEAKEGEAKIQTLTDTYVTKCEKHLELKEKEIMTV
jgi:ribosome recycling factor